MGRSNEWVPVWSALWTLALIGCGGAATQTARTTPATEAEAEAAETENETAAATPSDEGEPSTESAEAEVEPVAGPEPLIASSAQELHAALVAASSESAALRRLLDPAYGLGTHGPGDVGVSHHCDVDESSNHPGFGFLVHEEDQFSCDRSLRRCSSRSEEGGYAFYFRTQNGGAVTLDVIVHYENRVPRTDSAAIRRFADGGQGVCGLFRSLNANDRSAPNQFSVYVSSYTGLTENSISEHHCGNDAAQAYNERLASLSPPAYECARAPARCSFTQGDEEVTVYGGEEGPTGIAITRPGMYRHLDRGQQQQWDAFIRGLDRHSCD